MQQNRIPEKILNSSETLEDLFHLLYPLGSSYSEIGDFKNFEKRLEHFKTFLKTELPDFSIEELLKIDKAYRSLQNMYNWYGHFYFFVALEFEQHKNNKT